MDKTTVFRLLLTMALVLGAIWWVKADRTADKLRVQEPPAWVRALDLADVLVCIWSAAVVAWAIIDSLGPLFVRDWLQGALPWLVGYPRWRRRWGARALVRDLEGLRQGVE